MLFVEYPEAALFYNALKTFYSDLRIFYLHQFLNDYWVLSSHFQYPAIQKTGKYMIVGKYADPLGPAHLLMAAKRHIPWRKSKKYLPARLQKFPEVGNEFFLLWYVLYYILENDDIKETGETVLELLFINILTKQFYFASLYLLFKEAICQRYALGSKVNTHTITAPLNEWQQHSALGGAHFKHGCTSDQGLGLLDKRQYIR